MRILQIAKTVFREVRPNAIWDVMKLVGYLVLSLLIMLGYLVIQWARGVPQHILVVGILFIISLMSFLALYVAAKMRRSVTAGATAPAPIPAQPHHAREQPQPNLVCLDEIDFTIAELTDNHIVHETDEGNLPSIVVRIANEPDRAREIGSIENVMARLVFIGPNGDRLATVQFAYWIDEDFQSTDFFGGTIRGLLIGWLEMPGDDEGNAQLRTMSNNHERWNRYRPPTWIDVPFPEREQIRVQIRLYAHNFLRECEVWFSLDSSEHGEGFKSGILSQPA